MGKLVLAAVVVGTVLFFGKCGPSRAQDVAFSGAWVITTENGISGAKDEETVSVAADKKMFRTVSRERFGEAVAVYDGGTIYEKYNYTPEHPAEPDADGAAPPPAAPVRSEKMSEMRTGPRRFWSRSFVGQSGPGGQIAGRETMLYQAREKRPDGEITVQGWVDARTGVVLKSVETIYSSQVNSMVSKITRECQTINYGPVDPSTFAKP